MAIEAMTFVEVEGHMDQLDAALEACLASGAFQPEQAGKLGQYAIGASAVQGNPYADILVRIMDMADQMGVPIQFEEAAGSFEAAEDPETFIRQATDYLDHLQQEYPSCFERKARVTGRIESYGAALEVLSRLQSTDVDFDSLFGSTVLKVRFGRIPSTSLPTVDSANDSSWVFHPMGSEPGWLWGVYLTSPREGERVDAIFRGAGFERMRLPDFVHGTPEAAIKALQSGLEQEQKSFQAIVEEADGFLDTARHQLMALYTRVKFRHDARDLRRYVVAINGAFHLVGFVPTEQKQMLAGKLAPVPGISIRTVPAREETRLETPVRLKNNRFVRPYEMFVTMYGTPSYHDIDPTPFVAYTYTLLFGIMFGDLGQGLCIFLLGLFLWKKKGMQLGGIMQRIGISSACFGVIYGSVFGFEHALDPMFHALGFEEKPIEVMHPTTTTGILLAAVAMGAVIILMVIIFNICIGIRHRDAGRTWISPNGIAGFVFYGSVLVAVGSTALGHSLVNRPYVLCLLVLPLAVIFLREPIIHFWRLRAGEHLIRTHEDRTRELAFQQVDSNIHELFSTTYISARFGYLPADSYENLHFYGDQPFLIYPLKNNRDDIWCIYTMASTESERIDAIFDGLGFRRVEIPEECLSTAQEAERYMTTCMQAGEVAENPAEKPEEETARRQTMRGILFPHGIGAFVTESFFELFEVLLSFITNTMSFLRVGGFILSHAGMMSVVLTLSEMVGAGAGPLVIIVGNLFVMGLEGLIVGIQALRLEFYEIFSRFYDARGIPFKPASVDYRPRAG